MDFKELLKPYSDPMEDGRPKRTIEGQVKWLTSKGIPREFIDQAILRVFDELDRGRTFESGHELDRYLLDTAKDLLQGSLSKQTAELEAFMNSLTAASRQRAVEEYIKTQKGSVWKRVKAVFKP